MRKYAAVKVTEGVRVWSLQAICESASDLLDTQRVAIAFLIAKSSPSELPELWSLPHPRRLCAHRRDLKLLIRRADHEVLAQKTEAAIGSSTRWRYSRSRTHDLFINADMPSPFSQRMVKKPQNLPQPLLHFDPDARRAAFAVILRKLVQFKATSGAPAALRAAAAYDLMRHDPGYATFQFAENAMPEDSCNMHCKAADGGLPVIDRFLRLIGNASSLCSRLTRYLPTVQLSRFVSTQILRYK